MFNLQFEEPYLSKAQEIMGTLCTEVGGEGPKMIDILMDFMDKVNYHTKGLMQISKVNFGEELMPETPLSYANKHQAGIFGSVMGEENSALMISAERGAVVHCFSYIQVGDKTYVAVMNPQTALEIRDAMREMVDLYKENDQTKAPEQLTIWDKICDWFAQKFLDRPGEAVGRVEAYRNFYEGMQKHMDMLAKVEQATIAQRFERRHEYPAGQPDAAQNEEMVQNIQNIQQANEGIQQGNEGIEQVNEVIPQPDEIQQPEINHPVEEQPKPVEEQPVDEEQQINEAPKAPGRRIEKRWVNLNAEKQKLNPQEQSFWVAEEIDLDALDEEIAREKAEKERQERERQEELQRKYDEALQQRNEAVQAKAERIAGYKQTINECEKNIKEWKPKWQAKQEIIDGYNKQLRELDEYDMTHKGRINRNIRVRKIEDLENNIKKIEEKMSKMDEGKKFWDRKEKAEKNIETTGKAIEDAKLKLKDAEADLRSADMDLQYWSAMGQSNGAWMTPEEFLENQYNQDKAERDRKFAEEQKARTEKITGLEKELVEYQKVAKNHSKKMGWFSSTEEQKNEQAVYDKYVKTTKETLSALRDEDKQANKQHLETDKAKRKELLSPSKDLLAKTGEQLKDIRSKFDAAFEKFKLVGTRLDQVKNGMFEKQEAHENAINYYKKNFEGKTFKFDAIEYNRLDNEKLRLGQALQKEKLDLEMFDANVANYDSQSKAILDKLVPIQFPNADLQMTIRVWEEKLKDAKEKLEEEQANEIAPLNMEDPRKKNGPVMGGGMGPGGL